MKPGPVIVLLILGTGVFVCGMLVLKGCSDFASRQAAKASREQQQFLFEQRVRDRSVLAQQQLESDLRVGESEIPQAEFFYDGAMYAKAYAKFKSATDKGAGSSELTDAKAIITFLMAKDFDRAAAFSNRCRGRHRNSDQKLSILSLANRITGNKGMAPYYVLLEALAFRGSGNSIGAKEIVSRELSYFTPTDWPSPLLMYYSGDLTKTELERMVNGLRIPEIEIETFAAIENHYLHGPSSSTKQELRRVSNRLRSIAAEWEIANKLWEPLCNSLADGTVPQQN